MDRLLERFWEYIAINTQSKSYTKSKPSSAGQLKLAKLLLTELTELGASASELLENDCVMAKPPAKYSPWRPFILCLQPDAKIGRGANNIDLKKFNVQWAYSLVGGGIGGLEYENFNIANVKIKIIGKGTLKEGAKEGMVNALTLATRIHNQIPSQEIAKYTIMDQGFFHLNCIKGIVEKTEMNYIICDFDDQNFAKRKRAMFHIAEEVGKDLHSDCYIELTVDDICYNMNKVVCQYPHVIEIAKQAMIDCNIKPIVQPIRDITDSALLADYEILCPNIF